MPSTHRSDSSLGPRSSICLWLLLALSGVQHGIISSSYATTLVLKNGVELSGALGKIPSLNSHNLAKVVGGNDRGGANLIYVIDDGLRRSFVSTYQVHGPRDDVETLERIRLKQPDADSGKQIGRVGAVLRASPFDEYGRRRIQLATASGPIEIIQGITDVTPRFVIVRALKGLNSYVWDMRLATSSIPRKTLSRILQTHLDATDPDDRLRIVRLYLQSERYGDAEAELREAIEAFPDELANLKQQLREIRQLSAEQQLEELKIRRDSGQHALVQNLIPQFPSEGVAGAILLEVQDLQAEYEALQAQMATRSATVAALVDEIDPARRAELLEFQAELESQLNLNNVSRLTGFAQLMDKDDIDTDQKLAVAMSGWLTDGRTSENLGVARSLWRSRALVIQYLNSKDANERKGIIANLKSEEGGSVPYIAQLLAAAHPPRSHEADGELIRASEWVPQLYQIRVPEVLAGRELSYSVQLPPEYDPFRRYPTVVTLHAQGTTPEHQIDWWAGAFNPKAQLRTGPASRSGYIVIAPAWARPGQEKYEYSANEHAAVLTALRDAMGRFSIDTNRVFLSGHSMGGDAAWDIALAHPDLWAGVIPVSAKAAGKAKADPKYVTLYWKNARYVPQYFVGGSKDTDRVSLNARDFDRYLKTPNFDTIIVEYLGRGHEHFQDEIHRIFDWMSVHERRFLPEEFEAYTMRPWDSFFWWLEVEGLPPRSVALPHEWPKRGVRPLTVRARVNAQSNILVTAGVDQATILLAPPLVDFQQDISVSIGNRPRVRDVQPQLETILEDARTRHDRLQPFWAKVTFTQSK